MLGTHFYTFQAQETQDGPQAIPPEAIARLYCHAMVSMMPDEALPDLVDNLHDLELQFVKPNAQINQTHAAPGKVVAKLGTPVSRPDFYSDGE